MCGLMQALASRVPPSVDAEVDALFGAPLPTTMAEAEQLVNQWEEIFRDHNLMAEDEPALTACPGAPLLSHKCGETPGKKGLLLFQSHREWLTMKGWHERGRA